MPRKSRKQITTEPVTAGVDRETSLAPTDRVALRDAARPG
jgi:hypothetical protein